MSSFSVSGNLYLRQLYGKERELASGSQRLKVNTQDLAKADTQALKRGIASLSSYDYDKEKDDPAEYYKTLKAFSDTYNQTLESTNKLSADDSGTKRAVSDIKKLQQKYGDELKSLGINFDSKGYMSISNSALDHISVKNYKDTFGSGSEFLKDLSGLQKKLSRRIDYLV